MEMQYAQDKAQCSLNERIEWLGPATEFCKLDFSIEVPFLMTAVSGSTSVIRVATTLFPVIDVFRAWALPGLTFLLSVALPIAAGADDKSMIDVWLGTGSTRYSKGIYHCLLNSENGRLTDPVLVAEISGPGFLTQHPTLRCLYAVGTLDEKPSVACYSIESTGRNAALKLMNSLEIGDGGAAHVAVDQTGKMLLTAQYGGGSVAVFSLNDDGSLKERTQLVEHEGGSEVVKGRQDAPHAHWVGFSPDNRFAFVPDLGLDQVVIYRVDHERFELDPHGSGLLSPGAGPRHMKFHPNGKWIFVLHELDLAITSFEYDAKAGTMSPRQVIDTVNREALAKEKTASCSEIRIHPNGKFAYAANRGHDTITVFRINDETGELSFVELENVRGATPRNFNIDPSGKWLLAAGQDSHTLASFEINQESGELTYNRSVVHAPSCICVLIDNGK